MWVEQEDVCGRWMMWCVRGVDDMVERSAEGGYEEDDIKRHGHTRRGRKME